MEWYEIILGIIIFNIGIFISIKMSEWRKNRYHNESWKDRKK